MTTGATVRHGNPATGTCMFGLRFGQVDRPGSVVHGDRALLALNMQTASIAQAGSDSNRRVSIKIPLM